MCVDWQIYVPIDIYGIESFVTTYITSDSSNGKRNMIRHLRNAQNKDCLELYSGSSDPREMAWVRAVQENVYV